MSICWMSKKKEESLKGYTMSMANSMMSWDLIVLSLIPARNKRSIEALKEIVLARVANPDSKRGSVVNLEANFAVNLDLNLVYRMMDKIEDKQILKLNKLVLH